MKHLDNKDNEDQYENVEDISEQTLEEGACESLCSTDGSMKQKIGELRKEKMKEANRSRSNCDNRTSLFILMLSNLWVVIV